MKNTYEIQKTRIGTSGRWYLWRYEVVITNEQSHVMNISLQTRWALNRAGDKSLDSLAKELSKLPDIRNSQLIVKDEPRAVSMLIADGGDALTQYGRISDKKLGKLGALVQKYAMEESK